MGANEHRPCPFCGAPPQHLYATAKAPGKLAIIGYVACMGCGAEGPTARIPWEESPGADLMTSLGVIKKRAWELWDGERI